MFCEFSSIGIACPREKVAAGFSVSVASLKGVDDAGKPKPKVLFFDSLLELGADSKAKEATGLDGVSLEPSETKRLVGSAANVLLGCGVCPLEKELIGIFCCSESNDTAVFPKAPNRPIGPLDFAVSLLLGAETAEEGSSPKEKDDFFGSAEEFNAAPDPMPLQSNVPDVAGEFGPKGNGVKEEESFFTALSPLDCAKEPKGLFLTPVPAADENGLVDPSAVSSFIFALPVPNDPKAGTL